MERYLSPGNITLIKRVGKYIDYTASITITGFDHKAEYLLAGLSPQAIKACALVIFEMTETGKFITVLGIVGIEIVLVENK